MGDSPELILLVLILERSVITLPAGKVCPLLAGVPQGSLALAESSRTSERKVMLESRERGCILPEPGFGAEPVCIHRHAGTCAQWSTMDVFSVTEPLEVTE